LAQQPYEICTVEDVEKLLNQTPPGWIPKGPEGWRYLTTLEQHLATYQASSKYALFNPDIVR
jgi:hypothetical protein